MTKQGDWNILIEKEINKLILLLIIYSNYCKVTAAAEKELLVFILCIAGDVKAQLIRGTSLKQRDKKSVGRNMVCTGNEILLNSLKDNTQSLVVDLEIRLIINIAHKIDSITFGIKSH